MLNLLFIRFRRALGKSFRIIVANFLSLLWILMRIASVALAGSAAAFWFFVKVIRPEQVGFSMLLGQMFVIFWLAIRYWLRACETVWYRRKFPAPTPAPEVAVELPAVPTPAVSEPPSDPAPPLASPSNDTSS